MSVLEAAATTLGFIVGNEAGAAEGYAFARAVES